MRFDRRLSGLVLTLATVLAACSGAATATPTLIPATATPTAPAASAPVGSPVTGSLTIYAAIVYVTDAKTAGSKVMTITVPPAANVPATYGAVAVKASTNAAAAAAFITLLAGPDGQAILLKYGFLPPG